MNERVRGLGPPALPITVAVVALAASAFILARPPRPRDPVAVAPWMSRLDLDADGCIDRRDFAAQADHAEDFGLFDGNRDGCLDAVEIEVLLLYVDPKWIEIPAH